MLKVEAKPPTSKPESIREVSRMGQGMGAGQSTRETHGKK